MMKRNDTAEFPVRHPSWRVEWWDFRAHHDFIGPAPVRAGGVHRRARPKKPPRRQSRDFFGREAADQFAARLREQIPPDELVLRIASLRELRPWPPSDQMLPGSWPLQKRDS